MSNDAPNPCNEQSLTERGLCVLRAFLAKKTPLQIFTEEVCKDEDEAE